MEKKICYNKLLKSIFEGLQCAIIKNSHASNQVYYLKLKLSFY
ncbi:MAG: hypothetical protein JWM09_369 [Francisellaceae bacterium]|nr:hypothetical protein [Francisellaceae bacterium]